MKLKFSAKKILRQNGFTLSKPEKRGDGLWWVVERLDGVEVGAKGASSKRRLGKAYKWYARHNDGWL